MSGIRIGVGGCCFGVFLWVVLGTSAHGQTIAERIRHAMGRTRPAETGPVPRQRPALPAGWVTHRDPSGFTLATPGEWQVRVDKASGRVDLVGQAGERAAIWPVFIPAPAGDQSARFSAATASAVAAVLLARQWPDFRWRALPASAPNVVRAAGAAGDRQGVGLFAWASTPRGAAGLLYVATTPATRYRGQIDTFSAVFRSFLITGAPAEGRKSPGQRAVSVPRFVRWQDPREGAFSMDVPAGWRVEGGLARLAAVDTRVGTTMVSPDDEIRLFVGDAELPPFVEPSPVLTMAGFREGGWYSPGYGINMMVQRFVPGQAFAAMYARERLARGCGGFAVASARDRADAVRAINAVYAKFGQAGIVVRLSAGEVLFACGAAGRPMQGYVFAGTQSTAMPGSGAGALWNVQYLFGGLARQERSAEANAILEHVVRSFAINPRWAAMQAHLAGQVSRIVAETNQEIPTSLPTPIGAGRRCLTS